MENKQFLIEIAVGDAKLKSSLKKALTDPGVQKQLGILGEGITEHLEKDVSKAASILGKVNWSELLGEKDFERLQQVVADTIKAEKHMIQAFAQKGDLKGLQDTIAFVSELGAELRAIDPDRTVAGLARSMTSFMRVIEPLSGKFEELANAPEKLAGAFGSMASSTNKSLDSIKQRAEKVVKSMNDSVLNAVKNSGAPMISFEMSTEDLERFIGELKDADALAAELNKEIESSQALLRKVGGANEKITSDRIKTLVQHEQKINALTAKLLTLQPSVSSDGATKDIDATVEKIAKKLENGLNKTFKDSFTKVIEEKLSTIRVKIDVPKEEELITQINDVIAKVNEKGTNSFKLVGAESAINAAQNQILKNTEKWHNDMKKFLKFDKKEDITLDLGAKMREIGSNVGEQMKSSIEEYFSDPKNKVAVPVELVMSGGNKATLEGGNVTINGTVGGGGITADDLMKAFTTPIEVKVQEEQKKNIPASTKLFDYNSDFAKNVLSVFDELFRIIDNGGENAKKIIGFFNMKGINLPQLKGKPMDILNAYETFLNRDDKSVLDDVNNRLIKGPTKNKATLAFAELLRDSVFRFDLKNIDVDTDIQRKQVEKLIKETFIPQSIARDSLNKIMFTKSSDYEIPTVEELDKLMADLPQVWGTIGEDFLPALESLKKLIGTIADPNNDKEIQRFKEAADKFATEVRDFYSEMQSELGFYKIGVFYKGRNKNKKTPDLNRHGSNRGFGAYLNERLDDIDYFELYSDQSGQQSRSSRQDALDRMSRRERYQVRANAATASYRSTEKKPQDQTKKVEISKFEPKERPNQQLKEIEASKKAAEARTKKIEEARKASEAEEKAAEELRKQQLEADKKRLKALRSQRTKNANKLKETEAEIEKQTSELPKRKEELQKELEEAKALQEKHNVEYAEAHWNYIQNKDKISEEEWQKTVREHLEINRKDGHATFALQREIKKIDEQLNNQSELQDAATELKDKNKQLDAEIKELAEKVKKDSVEPSKKPTVEQQLDAMPKAKDIQEMIDNVNAIDAKVEEAQKKADEFDERVNKNLKAEKIPKLGYTKSEKNNSAKYDVASTKSATLSNVLDDKTATKSSFAGLNKKEADAVKKLLTDRKLDQLINGKTGLGLKQDSRLEGYAKSRIQSYQNGLNKIDEFLLKYQDQTIQYVEDDSDLSEFLKDQNVTHMMAGNFKGSQEEADAVRAKIEEFRTRMSKAGKDYIVDYLDMWSDSNLRSLMKDNKTRNATAAQGDTILQEFYRRIVEGGVAKRGEAYKYLKDESAKYQKSIAKDEAAVGKLFDSAHDQLATTEAKETIATDRLQAEYKQYVAQWLQTIQQNMADISSDSFSAEEKALKIKKNEELRSLISKFAGDYFKTFKENLLDETQQALLNKRENVSYSDLRGDQRASLVAEKEDAKIKARDVVVSKADALIQRRFQLLDSIKQNTKNGKDTKSLEKTLSDVEKELLSYIDVSFFDDRLTELKDKKNDLIKKINDAAKKKQDTKDLQESLNEVNAEINKYGGFISAQKKSYEWQEEFEADLLTAKNATDEEWKQLKANQTKRRDEIDAAKYKELQGKQKSLLGDTKTKTAAGENTKDLVDKLDAINEEIRKYEVNASRIKDIEMAKLPDKASVATIRTYNTEMAELVKLQQESAKLEALGKDTSAKKAEIEAQKQRLKNRVGVQIESDKRVEASYDPVKQAADFIEKTDAAVYELGQRARDAEDNLRRAERDLAAMQSDNYKNTGVYGDKIKALKHEAVAGYVRSDEYKAARQKAVEKADEEFGQYLAEHFDEDVVNELAYEFSHEGNRGDRADISAMIMTPKLKEISDERDKLLKELAETTDEAAKQGLRDRLTLLRQEFDQELSAGNVGGEGIGRRLVSDTFSKMMTEERQKYTDGDAYKQLVAQKKENIKREIEEELKSDREATEAKVQEIKNASNLRKQQIRKATLENSEELRAAVDAQAQADGMGDSEEYKRSIVGRVKEDMLQQVYEETGQAIREQWRPYNDKSSEKRSRLYRKMYEELNAKTEEVVYNAVMSKIRVMLGEKAKTVMGLDGKRDELVREYTKDIVQQYEDGLKFEETNMYTPPGSSKPINIRDLVTKEVRNRVKYAEQQYIDASGQLGVLEYERNRAKSYGELGYDEALNPDVAKVRAETEARLTAEKAKQVALTEKLTTLTSQNADHKIVQSVAAELKAVEKEIDRLQMRAEGAANALDMRKNVREEELSSKTFTPDKVRLWLVDHIEEAKKVLESGTDAEKTKASESIARWEQKLADVEKVIEAAKPEAEKPKTVLDMITGAIRQGLANVTAGGNVDLDASLYNIATETTLQEILRLLGGNGAVEYANQLKKELAKDRPRYERKDSNDSGSGNKGGSSKGKSSWQQKEYDKLNEEGRRIYGELDAQAKAFTTTLKGGKKKYDENFKFVDAINTQLNVVKKLEDEKKNGTVEYIQEQTKLTVLYQDYYNKTFSGKKNKPKQADWAKNIAGLQERILFKSNRADALAGLGYGVVKANTDEPKPDKKSNKKASKRTAESKVQETDESTQKINDVLSKLLDSKEIRDKAETDGIELNEAKLKEILGVIIQAIKGEDGLGRDIDDEILSSKGQFAQMLHDAIIEAYKMVASGDSFFRETSYSADENGNVVDVRRGQMYQTTPANAAYLYGHTHPTDVLWGKSDFSDALKNTGLFKVLELMTPLNTYQISGFDGMSADKIKEVLNTLYEAASDKVPQGEEVRYNEELTNKIKELGLQISKVTTGLENSSNFQRVRNASVIQSVSDKSFSIATFRSFLTALVSEMPKIGYEFDEDSEIGKLVSAIEKINSTAYSTTADRNAAFEELRPMIENVFGKVPDTKIYAGDRANVFGKAENIFDSFAQDMQKWRQIFAMLGKSIYSDGLGRDDDTKTDVKDGVKAGVKEGVAESSSTTKTSDGKMPYAVDPNSLIGKLQNVAGGDTGALAKQATLALVLSELQAINKKIATAGKPGVKSSAQHLLEEFQKMAAGSAMDGKERLAYFDAVNGAMSPTLSGRTHNIPQTLIDTLSQDYGIDKGYRSQVHTHADSDQTWFSKQDLNYMKSNIGDFGADSIKQQILLTKDTITVFDMTMVETAENAKKAIDILIKAGENVDNESLEKLTELGARFQSKDIGAISAKGLMDLLGVKNYQNDSKKKNTTLSEGDFAKRQEALENEAKRRAKESNSQYVFKNFDGEALNYQLVDIEGKISKVTLAWDEAENKVREVSNTSTSSLDPVIKKIQQYKSEIQSAQQEKLLLEGDDAGFAAAEKAVDDVIAKIQNRDPVKDDLNAMLNELAEARQKLADEGSKLHKLIAQNEKRRGGTIEVKQAITQGTRVRSLIGGVIGTDDDDAELLQLKNQDYQFLQDYIDAYNDLIMKQREYIKDGSINSTKTQDALKVQTAGVKKLGIEAMAAHKNTKALEEASAHWEQQSYTDKNGKVHALGGSTAATGIDREAMLRYAQEVLGANLESVKLNATTGKLTGVLRKNNYVVADMAVQYDKGTGKMHLFQEKERESLSGIPGFLKGLQAKKTAIMQYLISMTSIYRVFGELRKGIQYVREIDKALTELKKVTDGTEETYDKFLHTAAKTGARLGSTISAVTEATATFAKLGYSIQQASEMAEAAIVYKNVGDNIASTEDAANSIISTLKGFGMEASESMAIVDKFNEVGNRFAITSQGIGEALRLSASALNEGKNSLDESIALITAANEVVNDPSSVGTALKTLTLRLRGSKTELEEMGEDVSDMATTTSQLQAKLLALTGGKVDIMLDANTFKNSTQILREMADAWEDMNDIQRAEWCPYVQKCA